MPLALATYVHNIDRFAIEFWPGGPPFLQGIRWYGLSYLLGFLIGYLLIRRVVRVGKSTLALKQVGDYVVTVALGGLIGGRLGYAVFYDPRLFVDPPLIGLLQLWRGGMSSHGGLIGAVLAILCFAYRRRQSPLHMLDLGAFATPLGLFFGRIANFINGELYGRPAPAWLPWAVKFPQEIGTWSQDRITNLLARLRDLSVFQTHPPRGFLEDWVAARIQAGDRQVLAAVEPLLTPRHPSQLYQALLEGLCLFLVLLFVWRRPRKPGIVSGWFLVGYGFFRIVGEIFRLPDADIGYQWLGLTRGQWLSTPMIVIGLLFLILCQRRATPLMGSWRRQPS